MYTSMELNISEGLARLTLTRAQAGNPFNAEFCTDLRNVAHALGQSDARALLITAQGRFFSVGGDIAAFHRELDQLPGRIRDWTADLHLAMARLARLNLPIIIAVHGVAMGGAVALTANSDVVFASKSAKFGAAYPQIGYSPDSGATFGLASRLGLARARRFMLLNETLSAQDAAQAGLVDFLVDDAELLPQAEALAVKLSQGPTRAYGEIRRVFSRALGQPFEAQLEDEAQGLIRVSATADAREGIVAFVEKRRANFQGR